MTGYGLWIGASHALGRPVPVGGPYPHICHTTVDGRMPGSRVRLNRRDCAACATPQSEVSMPDQLTTLAAALELAGQGLPVFLLGRSKRPVANCDQCPRDDPGHDPAGCGHLTCHGFYAASRDPDRIAGMVAAVPGGMLAVRTGSAAGVVVVDIDPRNGGRVVPELMPPTRAVRTGSGGWHLYYAHPGGPLGSKVTGLAGVDVKADGGYVVAPPSVHPGTGVPYRWIGDRPIVAMPPGLVDACRPADPLAGVSRTSRTSRIRAGQRRYGFSGGTAQAVPAATGTGGGGISSPPALLAARLSAVARAPEGRRRTTLYGAARGVARMVAAGAITLTDAYTALYRAGRAAGQTDRDTRAAIRGGFRDESVTTEGIAA
jgi:Bifunctional DNA primase/polymerase, N-terminal